MQNKARFFAASFFIALIIIGTVCAFAAVDLSSDKYMPGLFNSMLQVKEIGNNGITLTFMGREYFLGGAYLEQAGDIMYRYRGLLPAQSRLVREIIMRLYPEP